MNKEESDFMDEQQREKLFRDSDEIHRIWHKFSKFLDENCEPTPQGWDDIEAIEKYTQENPEIKIVPCDDDIHASSIIVLIPHPKMGISFMFVPQLTNVTNRLFLYGAHWEMLIKELNKMVYVYDK